VLSQRDTAIARLRGMGYSQPETAARLKLSTRTVQRVMKQPEAQAFAQRIREQHDPQATDVLRALLSSANESIRLQAARTLLLTPVPDDDPDDDRPRITVYEAPREESASA
jgi:hypothetical protein